MRVAMFSSARARWYSSRVAPGSLGVDADDVEVERVRVARVARERLDAVELGDGLVVGARTGAAGSRACRSTLSSWTSAIAASTSERFAL